MNDTVNVPRSFLIKVYDTMTTLEGLLDGNKPADPKRFSKQLAFDITSLAVAADLHLGTVGVVTVVELNEGEG